MFITEHIEIPVTSGYNVDESEDIDSWKLCHTMVSNCELLQYLSFLDFTKIAASNDWLSGRRSEIFAISQPGGHPRNWQGVLNPSLNLVRKFTEKLKRHNCPEEFKIKKIDGSTDVNKNVVTKSVTVTLQDKLFQAIDRVKRYPVICYFLADLPDVTNRQIFSEAQPVIWSIKGLSDIVAASYREDQFGVLQRNIPDIVGAIVHLHQVLDKVSRVTIPRKTGSYSILGGGSVDSFTTTDFQLRKALRLTLRSCLYTICNTFGDSIKNISVSTEVKNKLQSYLDFKEG